MDTRKLLADWLMNQAGKPYIWAAKGPDHFDCSGLVTAGLVFVGKPKTCEKCGLHYTGFHNTGRLWDELLPIKHAQLQPLDLAFYGAGSINHVMFVWGDGRVYGAAGGNSSTVAPTPNARVKFKDSVLYRPDFRGYRQLPL